MPDDLMRMQRTSRPVPLAIIPEDDAAALSKREAQGLRVELRRVTGRLNFRRRRGWMFMGLLVSTLAGILSVAIFTLSPTDWAISQQSRFTQMTTLIFLVITATPIAGYFARRYDRQRERVRIARQRQREILTRLAQLDNVADDARRRRRRRKKRSWAWRFAHPVPFSRPPLESMSLAELEDVADVLGSQLSEERGLRTLGYAHAALTGATALLIAFVVTLSGPAYLSSFLAGEKWGGPVGLDPLIFWLTLTVSLIFIGGFGWYRVSVLLRRVRGYDDRTGAVERALWDARVLLRERREKL